MSKWDSVKLLQAQTAEVFAGNFAARANVMNAAADARERLSQTLAQLVYRARFKILAQSENPFYLMKLRATAEDSIAGLALTRNRFLEFRNFNLDTKSTSAVQVGPGWHSIELRMTVGTSGSVQVFLDGTQVPIPATHNLGTTPVGKLQLGDNNNDRTYQVVYDNVSIGTD